MRQTPLLLGALILAACGEDATDTSDVVAFTPSPPSALAITAQPSGAAAGQTLTTQPVLSVRDVDQNLVDSDNATQVTAAIASGGGTLQGVTVATAVAGIVTFTDIGVGGTVGDRTLTFSATGLTSATSEAFTVTPGPASQMSLSGGDNQIALAATALRTPLSVKVADAFDNGVEGIEVGWSVTSGSGNLASATSPTDAGGIAEALWTLGSAAGEQRVRAAVQDVSQSAEFSATAVDLRPVDTHTHLQPAGPGGLAAAAAVFAGTLPSRNLQWFVFMPQPQPFGQTTKYDLAELAVVLQPNADRVAFLGGGGSLNGMIQEAAAAGSVSAELRASFDSTSAALLAQGARGFGEIAAMHLSLFPGHPYESVAADHELLKRLADIAAQQGVPIDLHLDVVTATRPLPPMLASPPNPATLTENLAAFERLLEHNRGANIVWDHAGTDFTGQRTVVLMRQLLQRHSNLYISLTLGRHPPPTQSNSPLDADGRLRPEWVSLIEDFSDRFVLGSDHFYQDPGVSMVFSATLDQTLAILTQLQVDVAVKVGAENAKALFGLQ